MTSGFLQLVLRCHQTYSCLMILQSYLQREHSDRINGELRSQTKSFVSKIGTDANASVLNEIETVTKNLIADVDVAGYRVKESDVVVNGTQYRVYVLLEYSSAEQLRF